MTQRPKTVHLVDYLTASLGNTENAGEIVVITIRPDKDSFRPHNIALLRSQADRLLKDLKRLLTVPAILLLLFLMSGCSSRVQVTTEKRIHSETSERVEKFHTDVALGVLADQEEDLQSPMAEKTSVDVAVNVLPDPTQEEPPPQVTKLVTNIHNTVINVAGDHHQHHHNHFHQALKRIEPTSSPIRVEVQRRPIDPRCERLRMEYLERTREWRMLFPNLK